MNVIATPHEDIASVVLTIDEPAYVDMPIWASIKFQGHATDTLQGNLRYPFAPDPAFTWRHSFEVSRDGVMLAPRKVQQGHGLSMNGVAGGTVLRPPRLQAACRCICSSGSISRAVIGCAMCCARCQVRRTTLPLTSAWVTLQVQQMTAEQRRKWQQEQVAHPPTDAGLLVGNYLPSLLASPDATVLPAFIAAQHQANALVSSYALQSMAYFDDAEWQSMVFDELRQHGPSSQLVELLSCQHKLTEAAKIRLVAQLIPYLAVADPIRVDGALQSLSLVRGSVALKTAQCIDTAVLSVAQYLRTLNPSIKRILACYLGGVKSDRSRKVLWQLAGDNDARNQALRSLCRIGDSRDTRRLADAMRTAQLAL